MKIENCSNYIILFFIGILAVYQLRRLNFILLTEKLINDIDINGEMELKLDTLKGAIEENINHEPYGPYSNYEIDAFKRSEIFPKIDIENTDRPLEDIQKDRLDRFVKVCDILLSFNKTLKNILAQGPTRILKTISTPEQTHQLRPVKNGYHNTPNKTKILMCVSPKTGTTNWQIMGLALERNVSIKSASKNLPGNVYRQMARYSHILGIKDKKIEGTEKILPQQKSIWPI